jgi:hypothetical protein
MTVTITVVHPFQPGEIVAGHSPPILKDYPVSGQGLDDKGIRFDELLYGGFPVNAISELQVSGSVGLKEDIGLQPEAGEIVSSRLHFVSGMHR